MKEILIPSHMRLPQEHLRLLQEQADREHLKLSDIVRRALREWLEMQEKKNA